MDLGCWDAGTLCHSIYYQNLFQNFQSITKACPVQDLGEVVTLHDVEDIRLECKNK